MEGNKKVNVEALREMLVRVSANVQEEKWRRDVARLWLKKLEESEERWKTADYQANRLDGALQFQAAYLLRTEAGQAIDLIQTIIRDSAELMFSEYMTGGSEKDVGK